MPAPQDLIHVVSTTTGTGDMTVSTVVRNFSDSDAFGTGTTTDVFDYSGWNADVAGEWERGTGHMSVTNTLVRDTIKASSNGGAAVNWSAGTKHFSNDVPAAKQVSTDSAQTLTNKTLTSANFALAPTSGDVVTVTPASGTTDKGLNVSCSGPTSGSYAGPLYFNHIEAFFNAPVTGTGLDAQVSALQVNLGVGSTYEGVEAYGLSVGCVPTGDNTTTSDYVGLSCGVSQEHAGNGRLYGGSAAATLGASGTAPAMYGFEIDQFLLGPGTSYNVGLSIGAFGDHQAPTVDTCIGVWSSGDAGVKPFKSLVTFISNGGTQGPPLDVAGSLFTSEGDMTVANVFDLANVTVTGNILKFPSAVLTGAGTLIVGDLTTNNGAVSVIGPAGGNAYNSFQLGGGVSGNPNWTFGIDGTASDQLYFYGVSLGKKALSIDAATNNVTALCGLSTPTSYQSGTTSIVGDAGGVVYDTGSGAHVTTLPDATKFLGRWLHVKNIASNPVTSASANVSPFAGGAPGTALLSAGAKWATLQSNGVSWVIMAAN